MFSMSENQGEKSNGAPTSSQRYIPPQRIYKFNHTKYLKKYLMDFKN